MIFSGEHAITNSKSKFETKVDKVHKSRLTIYLNNLNIVQSIEANLWNFDP